MTDDTNMEYVSQDIVQEDGGAVGHVAGIDIPNKAIYFVPTSGDFSAGNRLSVGEIKIDSAKKYLKFDNSGNVTDLLDSPQSPAYTSTDENPVLKLTFPDTFPSGDAPDQDLLPGTTLTVTVAANNGIGSDVQSGSVQPKTQPLPNPGDSYGGGFFVGQVFNDSKLWNIIVAPVEENGLNGLTSSSLAGVKHPTTRSYGGLNTLKAIDKTGYSFK